MFKASCCRCIIICFAFCLIVWQSVCVTSKVMPDTPDCCTQFAVLQPSLNTYTEYAKQIQCSEGQTRLLRHPLISPGVTGGPAGSVNQGEHLANSMAESPAIMHAAASVSEGVCQQEKYSLLVCIFTIRDKWALEPHAWVKDLLKDFFQSMLGINMSVALLSLTECLIFCGNCLQGQGMSFDESLWYAHQLTGVHPGLAT